MTQATWLPVLLALAIPAAALVLLPRRHPLAAAIMAGVCLLTGVRYAYWRLFYSLPENQTLAASIWTDIFLSFEMVTLVSTALLHVFMTRRIDRSADVDTFAHSRLLLAPVDVMISTYNESAKILERTILGALAITHPDLRVWVLDDGNRPWLKTLATELGAHYHVRDNRLHAKAGNVNAGFAQCLTVGRRPEFLLLLDADFVADQRILSRTLPLFEQADVGIVQTPQHFFNADPMQANLLCTRSWPDEQRFFFNVLLPCKDAWGAAFCCGTSAVFRTEALMDSEGLATETVTEDMLTSFKMQEHGWRTIFLNERLSLGLAPEGIRQYVSQRGRWCLGAIQQIFTRWSFFGPARMTLVSRISSLDGFLYWACVFPYKLMVMSAPMLFWWFGANVLDASADELLFWFGPYAAATTLFIVVEGEKRAIPVLTDVSQLLIASTVTATVALALVKPFGHPFKVTAKDVSMERTVIHWGLMAPLLFIAIGTGVGMLANLGGYSAARSSSAYSTNILWSLLNIAMLTVACAVCVEQPQLRRDERFVSDEPGFLIAPDLMLPCRLMEISMGGASLSYSGDWPDTRTGSLMLDSGALSVPFEITRASATRLSVRFQLDTGLRRQLIVKLFTGNYSNEVETIAIRLTLWAIARRVMG